MAQFDPAYFDADVFDVVIRRIGHASPRAVAGQRGSLKAVSRRVNRSVQSRRR